MLKALKIIRELCETIYAVGKLSIFLYLIRWIYRTYNKIVAFYITISNKINAINDKYNTLIDTIYELVEKIMSYLSCFIIITTYFTVNTFAYSDPSTWDQLKSDTIDLSMEIIADQEKFIPYCYKDGKGYSIGYGDHRFCWERLQLLYAKNPYLRLIPDTQALKYVTITKSEAKWRMKKHIIELYDKLETKMNIELYDYVQLTGLISFIYSIGETKFYKSNVFRLIQHNKASCGYIKYSVMEWNRVYINGKHRISKGLIERRILESNLITGNMC